MNQIHTSEVLSRLLDPLSQMMPLEFAEKLAALRATPEIQFRLDELAARCTEGELTSAERAEYDAYIDAVDVISILQAKARGVIARQAR